MDLVSVVGMHHGGLSRSLPGVPVRHISLLSSRMISSAFLHPCAQAGGSAGRKQAQASPGEGVTAKLVLKVIPCCSHCMHSSSGAWQNACDLLSVSLIAMHPWAWHASPMPRTRVSHSCLSLCIWHVSALCTWEPCGC